MTPIQLKLIIEADHLLLISGIRSDEKQEWFGIQEPKTKLLPIWDTTHNFNNELETLEEQREVNKKNDFIIEILVSGYNNNSLFFPSLSKTQKEVITLLLISGLSQNQIALDWQCSRSAVHQLVRAIRHKAMPYYLQIAKEYQNG
jgi:DNA-binding CsgD family transcriptional regulator